jgi:hypothetical protein
LPWCPYARKWLTGHPGLAGRVDIDWDEPPAARLLAGTEDRPESPQPTPESGGGSS